MRPPEPIAADDEHRVLKFRPRASDALQTEAEAPDPVDEPDDFGHRMWANAAAFTFTVVLVAFGIWLAVSISDLRKSQDCVLMGRRDCAHLSTRADVVASARADLPASTEPAARRH